jgi:hypothetical protein
MLSAAGATTGTGALVLMAAKWRRLRHWCHERLRTIS